MYQEDNLTIAVSTYLRMQYPKILFTHIANERQTTVKISKRGKYYTPRGNKLKRMGVCAGMPDIMIFSPKTNKEGRIIKCGCAIELKIKPNSLTDNQKACLEKLKEAGWKTCLCYTFDEAQAEIDEYLNS